MSPLTDYFKERLPDWIEEIEEQASEKISRSNFALACRQGNIDVMRALIKHFWPFVNEFPRLIQDGVTRFKKEETIKELGWKKAAELFNTGYKTFSEIQKDEVSHRELWLKTAQALDLPHCDLDRKPIAAVKAIIGSLANATDPFVMLMRIIAVELVAEAISKDLFTSYQFKSVLGEQGSRWFAAHISHDNEINHEQLAFQLAFALRGKTPTKEESNLHIQSCIDLFVEAGEMCVNSARPPVARN